MGLTLWHYLNNAARTTMATLVSETHFSVVLWDPLSFPHAKLQWFQHLCSASAFHDFDEACELAISLETVKMYSLQNGKHCHSATTLLLARIPYERKPCCYHAHFCEGHLVVGILKPARYVRVRVSNTVAAQFFLGSQDASRTLGIQYCADTRSLAPLW